MLKVYVAGSLFNEAEVAQRKAEGEIHRLWKRVISS